MIPSGSLADKFSAEPSWSRAHACLWNHLHQPVCLRNGSELESYFWKAIRMVLTVMQSKYVSTHAGPHWPSDESPTSNSAAVKSRATCASPAGAWARAAAAAREAGSNARTVESLILTIGVLVGSSLAKQEGTKEKERAEERAVERRRLGRAEEEREGNPGAGAAYNTPSRR